MVLPADDLLLKVGDRLLFCGRQSARDRMEWGLQNYHALKYILTGEVVSTGWIWRRFGRNSDSALKHSPGAQNPDKE